MNTSSTPPRERALLVTPHLGTETKTLLAYRAEELVRLADTAGAKIVDQCEQPLRKFNAATLIGSGKIEELKDRISSKQIDLVIINHELTPVQQRNLEKALKRRTIDRTELILDIFAQHAESRDGQIQVELAQLRYNRPRLTGRGAELSRLGGGIGTRGPGETKLETDRRRIDQRISRLRKELDKVQQTRLLQRKGRQRNDLYTLVLVGYTNAGKSSLLNRITDASVLAKDQLFSTLDTTTRRVFLNPETRVLLSDTVGFISNLPKPLLSAFRATLEVVEEADALLHVTDASSPFLLEQIHAVEEVLEKLGCEEIPSLLVFNKMDRVEDDSIVRELESQVPASIRCSAKTDPDMSAIKDAFFPLLDEAEAWREARAKKNDDTGLPGLDSLGF